MIIPSGWRPLNAASYLAAYLGIMLLAVDGAAGLALILSDILALIARHHAVGLGFALVLANFGFAAFQVGRLGTGEFARANTLANAGLLVVLASRDFGSSRLGRGRIGNTKQG